MAQKLYQVSYRVWNSSFSDLNQRERLSVGEDETEAIERVKQTVVKDARDFSAREISNVFGYAIRVDSPVLSENEIDCEDCEPLYPTM